MYNLLSELKAHQRLTFIKPHWFQQWAQSHQNLGLFFEFDGFKIQPIVGIKIGTYFALLLNALFFRCLIFIIRQTHTKTSQRQTTKYLAKFFNVTCRYINEISSLKIPHFQECLILLHFNELQKPGLLWF